MISRDQTGDETDQSPQIPNIDHHLSSEDEKLVTESRSQEGFLSGLWMTFGRIVPRRLRYRFISIDIESEKKTAEPGEEIPIEVMITNHAPITIPVSLRCSTFWGWSIDEFHEGTDTDLYTSNSKTVGVRGHQTYSLSRTWTGYIEYTDDSGRRFEPLSEGEHTLEAWINIPEPNRFGLRVSTTIEISR